MSISLSKVHSPYPGWYCGDFHAHTTCSDGAFSPDGLGDLATQHGLDFVAITDHNDVRAFDQFDETLDRLVLPGVEVTLYEGHFNVFGFEGVTAKAQEFFHNIVDLPPERKYSQRRDHIQLTALLRRLADAGLLIDIAHPLLQPWEWRDFETDIGCFHCIELVNDPTYRDNPVANPATRRMWSTWLNAGHRIAAIGGTDFHSLQPSDDRTRLSRLNLPLTYIYAAELSGKAILDGLRRRHAYVTMGPKIVFQAFMDGKSFIMGDELGEVRSPVDLYAKVAGCDSPAQARLIKNGTLVAETQVRNGEAKIEYEVLPESDERCWYRLDVIGRDSVIGHDDQSIAISNPFFFGPPVSPQADSFGSFINPVRTI